MAPKEESQKESSLVTEEQKHHQQFHSVDLRLPFLWYCLHFLTYHFFNVVFINCSSPLGQLNLVSLYGGVSIKSRKVMETVMSSFPNLEEINFVSHPHELMVSKDILSVQELKSLVFNPTNGVNNFWSKVF